ncbi:hypothetical protein Pint_31728 [Pistacia integerrima]|uniref:Uncharacterized protein n=1 Tax=Pistacia integerrima TaxID=434235 RepID=A0ACC0XMJ1_9ROSI|nr:hypothetical protein Pint_31728 [Pistacia integerrima]
MYVSLHLCYDLLLIHVSCRILPSKTFSCPLRWVGISNMIEKIEAHDYMGI